MDSNKKDSHKNLLIAAVLISSLGASLASLNYLNSVKQSASAYSPRDIQQILQQYKGSVALPAATKPLDLRGALSTTKSEVKAAGAIDLAKNSASADKTNLHVVFTNTTGADLTGAKLFFHVSGKGKFALGAVTGAKPLGDIEKLKSGYVGYTLPNLKPGETAQIDVPFIARNPGEMEVTAQLLAPGEKITSSVPVTINVNQ